MIGRLQIDNQFKNIIEPEEIPFTFDAPAWKVLFALIVLVGIVLALAILIRYIKNKYRRDATVVINQILVNGKAESRILLIVQLLKQMAINIYGRENAGNLTGEAWLSFLNSRVSKACFNVDSTLKVYQHLQDSTVTVSEEEILLFAKSAKLWVGKHKK